jgi:hypothetical protein
MRIPRCILSFQKRFSVIYFECDDRKAKLNFKSNPADGIGDDNIGKKMLQKLGWKAGEGLGKHGTGITAPIQVCDYKLNARRLLLILEDQAEMHVPGAGLGSVSNSLPNSSSMSSQDLKYQERVKLMVTFISSSPSQLTRLVRPKCAMRACKPDCETFCNSCCSDVV